MRELSPQHIEDGRKRSLYIPLKLHIGAYKGMSLHISTNLSVNKNKNVWAGPNLFFLDPESRYMFLDIGDEVMSYIMAPWR